MSVQMGWVLQTKSEKGNGGEQDERENKAEDAKAIYLSPFQQGVTAANDILVDQTFVVGPKGLRVGRVVALGVELCVDGRGAGKCTVL